MSRIRWRLTKIASALPFCLLAWLMRHVPVLRDDSDGWCFWLDAHYLRYVRFDVALWGSTR